ncbi:MAG: 50S ribosomal protein L17 [Deltaproteobacteria bacterium]|jgi:large subunit ribosomal protein L17|nr:50S ribosomal protein L17 [Deltaproteobacteria bacterium]
MRHRKSVVKLGRTAAHRDAMLRNMVTSLFEHGKIVTTLHKAKAVRPLVDRLITLVKRGDLHSIRLAAKVFYKKKVLTALLKTAKERFDSRSSGFTLMAKNGLRKGDVAQLVVLRLVEPEDVKAAIGSRLVKSVDRSRRVAASKHVAQSQGAVADASEETAEIQQPASTSQESGTSQEPAAPQESAVAESGEISEAGGDGPDREPQES